MHIESLLIESLELLALGMGSVFLILGMMILLVTTTSRLLARWAPEEPLPAAMPHRDRTGEDSGELIAVIQAAIHRYRSQPRSS